MCKVASQARPSNSRNSFGASFASSLAKAPLSAQAYDPTRNRVETTACNNQIKTKTTIPVFPAALVGEDCPRPVTALAHTAGMRGIDTTNNIFVSKTTTKTKIRSIAQTPQPLCMKALGLHGTSNSAGGKRQPSPHLLRCYTAGSTLYLRNCERLRDNYARTSPTTPH